MIKEWLEKQWLIVGKVKIVVFNALLLNVIL